MDGRVIAKDPAEIEALAMEVIKVADSIYEDFSSVKAEVTPIKEEAGKNIAGIVDSLDVAIPVYEELSARVKKALKAYLDSLDSAQTI